MDKFELATYMDWLLRRALCRCGRLYEAEELVSDTIVSALDALDEGVTITNPRAWLARILERRFCDMQRKRYREAASQSIYDSEPPDDLNLEQIFEDEETAEAVRRGIAMLSGIYREVVVQYYLNERSISEIAELYKLPKGTIKSRLSTGRRQLKEELEMEKYQRESYFPDYLYVSCSGQSGNSGEPWSLVANDRATMNLLIVAYAKPLTISEIADAIGVSAAYIEPVVKRLVDGQLMRCVANRYYTDFAIATEADRTANLPAILKLAEKITPELWGYIDEGLSMLRSRDYYKRQENTRRRSSRAAILQSQYSRRFSTFATRHTEVCSRSVNTPTDRMAASGTRWAICIPTITTSRTRLPRATISAANRVAAVKMCSD